MHLSFRSSLLPALLMALALPIFASGVEMYVVNSESNTSLNVDDNERTSSSSFITGLGDSVRIAASSGNICNYIGRVGEYTTGGATVNASLITGLDWPTGIVGNRRQRISNAIS